MAKRKDEKSSQRRKQKVNIKPQIRTKFKEARKKRKTRREKEKKIGRNEDEFVEKIAAIHDIRDSSTTTGVNEEIQSLKSSELHLKDSAINHQQNINDESHEVINLSSDSEVLIDDSAEEEGASEGINITLDSSVVDERAEENKCISGARFIEADNNEDIHGVLILTASTEVAISGKFSLNVIKGKIKVFGYEARKETQNVHVFSSIATGIFKLEEGIDDQKSVLLEQDKEYIKELFKDNAIEVLNAIEENSSAAIIAKIPLLLCHSAPVLGSCFNMFPKKPILNDDIPKIFAEIEVKTWEPLVKEILQCVGKSSFTSLLCGAKNIGKSTFARFFMNSALNCFETVYFLECDVGQTEFTAPAVISLSRVNKPLIGPPFTHQTKPAVSLFFGNIQSKDRPKLYTSCIKEAFDFYLQNCIRDGPLFINTQGWIKGLGLALLIDVIKISQPTFVIQLTASKVENPIDFNHKLIVNKPGWSYDAIKRFENVDNRSCLNASMDHDDVLFLKIPSSKNASKNSSRLCAKDYRRLALISYFNAIHELKLTEGATVFQRPSIEYPLQYFVPRILYWRDIAVHVMHCQVSPSMILHSMNFSLVSLATVHPSLIVELPKEVLPDGPKFLRENPIACHVGFAFVRNIDVSKKAFIILTPEREEALGQVNALLKGSVDLPPGKFNQERLLPSVYSTASEQAVMKVAAARRPRFNLKRKKHSSRSKPT